MSKKKAKPKKLDLSGRIDDEMALINGAAYRVNNVIQKITEPPETVLAHLKRIGVEPIIDRMQLDDEEPKTYVVFGYDDLLEKELEAIAKGNQYSSDYPKDRPSTPVKIPTEPILLDEIRRRMNADKSRHPSQLTLDDVIVEDEEWPIVGENPL